MPPTPKPMGLKRRGIGPFRGRTPKGIFQTVDVGTWKSTKRVETIAEKKRNRGKRKYAVSDTDLQPHIFSGQPNDDYQPIRANFENKGIKVYGKLDEAIKTMKEEGIKARHINFDMPEPLLPGNDPYNFRHLFAELPNILVPNGKIFIKTDADTLREIKKIADFFRLKARQRFIPFEKIKEWNKSRNISEYELNNLPLTATMIASFKWPMETGIYILEITYPLKKAFPDKAQRREWTKYMPKGGN